MKRIIQIPLLTSLLVIPMSAYAENFSQIYQQALNFDPQTKSAHFQALSAQTTIRQAKASLYPSLQFNAGYSRNDYKYNPKYGNKKIEQGIYTEGLQLNQNIYDPKVYANIKVQESKSQLSQFRYQYQVLSLAQDTLQAYLNLMNSQQKIQLLQSEVKLDQSKLKKIQKQVQLNLSSQVDILHAQIQLDHSQIALKKQSNLYKTNRIKLKKFIGDRRIHLATILFDDKVLQKIQVMRTYIKQKLSQINKNPQIQYAQESIVSAQAQIQQAQSDYWPKINLTASYNRYDTNTPNTQYSYEHTQTLGVNLSMPLYSGGQTNAQVDGAQLQKKAAEQDLKKTQNDLKSQSKEELAHFENTASLVPMYLQTIQASKRYLQATQRQYQKGLVSLIEVNDAQSKLYQAQYQYIDNMTQLIQSYITLLVITNQIQGLKLADALLIQAPPHKTPLNTP